MSRNDIYNNIRQELAEFAVNYLKTNYNSQVENNTSLQHLIHKWEQHSTETEDESIGEELKIIYLDLLNQQREWLRNRNKEDQTLDESIIRRQMHYLDIEEEKLRFL